MPGSTARLGLYLPGGGASGVYVPDEVADIDQLNNNFIALDGAMGAPDTLSTGRPGSPFDGQLAYETDTQNLIRFEQSGSSWQNVAGGKWQAFVPTIMGATTNPNLGTAPGLAGAFCRLGNTVLVHALITPDAGATAGSGNYTLGLPLPVDPIMSGMYIGEAFWVASGSSVQASTFGLLDTGGVTALTLSGTKASSSTSPVASGAHIAFTAQYQTTP